MSKINTHSKNTTSQAIVVAAVVILLLGFGLYFMHISRAATPFIISEAENGTLSGSAALVNDLTASGNAAIAFKTATTTSNYQPVGVSGNWSLEFDDEFDARRLILLNGA